MTIKTHGRMMTSDTIGITQLDLTDGTANQAIVTDGQGVLRFATVGAGGSVGSSVYVEDIRTGDGTTTTFTLSTAAPYEESILVFIDGVAQPTSSFTLPSTTSITFSPAPGNGAAIRICHLGIASSVADCSITGAKICMGGDTAGDILFYNGTSYQRLVIGSALQILRTNAAVNAPEWVDATTASLPAVGASGNVLTSDASNWSSQPPLGGVGGELVSIQSFAVNGTWTRPSGVTRIRVCIVGGGGGANANTGGQYSGGGGGAGYCESIFDVSSITTGAVVIGVGSIWASGSHNGPTNSTFTATGVTTMTATGGAHVSNGSTTGGAGGVATGGQLNLNGEIGAAGLGSSQGFARGGRGAGDFGSTFGSGIIGTSGSSVESRGNPGYCKIYEYSDASASLVGEKLVSHQMFSGVDATGAATWTKPAGVTKIRVYVQGAGGGSHGNGGFSAGAAGGGGCAIKIMDVTSITTLAYTIGVCQLSGGTVSATGSGFDSTGLSAGNYILNGSPGGSTNASSTPGTAGTANGGDFNISGTSGGGGTNGNSGGGSAGGPFGGLGHGGAASPSGITKIGTPGYVYIEEYSDPSLVSGGSLVPTGVVNPYAGATAPAGWLLCYGQSISRTTYATLFTAIGTTYGTASGTTFLLPDMRGRVAAGQDNMGGTSASRVTTAGGGLDGVTLGAVGGTQTHTTNWHGNVTPAADEAVVTSLGNLPPTIILNYIIKT
jgi:hypothetical protein